MFFNIMCIRNENAELTYLTPTLPPLTKAFFVEFPLQEERQPT